MNNPIKLLTVAVLILLVAVPCQAQDNAGDCPGILPSRLLSGKPAQTTPGVPNNVRDEPSVDATKVGEIPPETLFDVLEGPICADGYAWWHVAYEGISGWTVEGDAEDYWTIPVDTSHEHISVWNVESLRSIREFRGEENTAYGMAVTTETSLLALGTGYPNNVVRIWDYLTGEAIAVLDPGYNNDVRRVSFDSDGELLVIGGMPGDIIQVWHIDRQEIIHQIDRTSPVVTFRPQTKMIAYIDFPRDLVIWDVASESEYVRWPDAVQVLATDLVFSLDGNVLAIAESNGLVNLWDVESGELRTSLEFISTVTGIVFAADAETITTVHCREADPVSNVICLHLKIETWDVQTGQRSAVIDMIPGLDLSKNARLAISPDGTLLAMSELARLWIFEAATGRELAMLEPFPARNLSITDDQKHIIGAATNAVTAVWGLDS